MISHGFPMVFYGFLWFSAKVMNIPCGKLPPCLPWRAVNRCSGWVFILKSSRIERKMKRNDRERIGHLWWMVNLWWIMGDHIQFNGNFLDPIQFDGNFRIQFTCFNWFTFTIRICLNVAHWIEVAASGAINRSARSARSANYLRLVFATTKISTFWGYFLTILAEYSCQHSLLKIYWRYSQHFWRRIRTESIWE